jgi:hypothetical protein
MSTSAFVPFVTDSNTRTRQDVMDFLKEARERLQAAISAESVNRKEALEDLNFKVGKQWPEDIRAKRKRDQRPCLTINKVPTFVNQIVNDMRQNRPSINFSPVGDKASRETARLLRGMVRQTERRSAADISYDTAAECAVAIGWGFFRFTSAYEHAKTFNQVVQVERVRNPFCIYLDNRRQMPDGSDAKWAFVSDRMLKDEFKKKYPRAELMNFEVTGSGDVVTSWGNDSEIRVCEYFYPFTKSRELLALDNGHEGFEDELEQEQQDYIAAHPDAVHARRTVEETHYRWVKISAKDILEVSEWRWDSIPIIEVVGMETDIEGKVTREGIIRAMKDPQRMYNYWVTREAEEVAQAPLAKYVMEEGQLEDHEDEWRQSNTNPMPVLTYKSTNVAGHPAPPPQPIQAPAIPEGTVQAKAGAAQDMMGVTGVRFDSTLAERTYDESGVALKRLEARSEVGYFHYIDNFTRSLHYAGKVFLSMLVKVYDTPRLVTVLHEDDKEEQVMLDPHAPVSYSERILDSGQRQKIFNPNLGQYEVVVTTGPSYATRRIESVAKMVEFVRSFPQAAPLTMDLIAKNSDWPGAEEISKRLATLVPPQALLQDQKDMSPQVQALVNSMARQVHALMLERMQLVKALSDKDADRQLKLHKIDSDMQAKLLQIFAKIQGQDIQQLTDAVQDFVGSTALQENPA